MIIWVRAHTAGDSAESISRLLAGTGDIMDAHQRTEPNMDPIRLDLLPLPIRAKKGHWGYRPGNPSAQWIEDKKFDLRLFVKEWQPIIRLLAALVTMLVGIATFL